MERIFIRFLLARKQVYTVKLSMTTAFWRILVAALSVANLYAQTPIPSQTQKPVPTNPVQKESSKAAQPLELPEFIITGSESIDIPGGAKQLPKALPALTPADLLRFNPLEKQRFSLLPSTPFRSPLLSRQQVNSFVRAEFGFFLTPEIEVAHRAVLQNFDVNATATAVLSNGHLPSADFTTVRIGFESTYLAADKFFFFGGSRTSSYLRAERRSYNLFAADTAILQGNVPARSVVFVQGGIATNGIFKGFAYDMGVDLKHGAFATMYRNEGTASALTTTALTNTSLDGHILGKFPLEDYSRGEVAPILVGGILQAHLQSNGTSLTDRFILTPSLTAESRRGAWFVEAVAGVQVVRDGTEFVSPNGKVHIQFTESTLPVPFTLHLRGFTGVRSQSINELLELNPYLPMRLGVLPNLVVSQALFKRSAYDGSFYAIVQPTKTLAFTLGASAESSSMILWSLQDSSGEILSANASSPIQNGLERATILRALMEIDWQPSVVDELTMRLRYTSGMTETTAFVPYLETFHIAATYNRLWHLSSQAEPFPTLRSAITVLAVSERRITQANVLQSYVDIRLRLDYQFSHHWSAYLRATNLANQRIEVWSGYRERGIFLAAGLMVTF
jgi:hypothetical protein